MGVGALLALGVTGCGGASSTGPKTPIAIGGETLLTGLKAPFGTGVLQGMEAGVYEVNHGGGVLGRKFNLIPESDNSDPVDAVPVAQKLIGVNKVTVEVGEAGAGAQAVAPLFANNHIPFFVPGGDTYFDNNSNPYVWRVTPSDSQLAVAMSLYAKTQGYHTAVAMFTTGAVQQGLQNEVVHYFSKLGGTMLKIIPLQPDLTSYSSEVATVEQLHPQVIFAEMDPGTAAVVFRNFESLGPLTTPFIGTDDMIGTTMIQAVGASVMRKVLVDAEGGLYNSPAVGFFNAAVKVTAHSAPDPNASYGYDGIILAALAMVEANSTNGPAINAALPKITAPGGYPVYNFKEGVAALKAGKRITYIGASGPFYFNKYHNVFGPFIIVRVNPAGTNYTTVTTLTATQLAKATK
ncbi:MAG: ABC transporter substrate-binding protein [Candidatus Dormibacteria bacterium]